MWIGIFEDNSADDQDGEFPSRRDLLNGQEVLDKMNGEKAFFLQTVIMHGFILY